MAKYLDYSGLSQVWQAIKTNFVAKEVGKGLSTNDFTDAYKDKLDSVAASAQVNTIETVKVNGTALTITNKAVDIDLSDYATTAVTDAKADKVAGATDGNFAGLDANGNLTDSGSKASDFATAAQGTKADSAIQGVKLSDSASALQPDASNVVTIPNATASADGLMSSEDFSKLSGIASGAQVNVIESISVNGNAATITDKAASVTIPEASASASGVMSAADKDKLDSIEASAETNIIEEVQVNGVALTPDANRAVNVVIPAATVTGVAQDEKIISLSNGALSSTLSVDIVNSGNTEWIVLKGIGNAEVAAVDAAKFVKDGMLDNVVLSGNSLVFTFNTDAGKQDITIDLTTFIDVYSAGNGLELGGEGNRTFAVKLAQTQGNAVLSFDENGGLKAAVDLNTYALSADVVAVEAALTAHTDNADIHVTKAEKDKWNASAHTHENKSVLDGITSEKVADWDKAAASAHTHSNKALLDTYTQTEVDLADAVSKKHEHANMAILTGITAAYTTEEQTKLSGIAEGAQVNVLEGVTLNGTDASISSKKAQLSAITSVAGGTYVENSGTFPAAALDIKSSMIQDSGSTEGHDKLATKGYVDAQFAGSVEGVQVNGNDLTLTNKKANVQISGSTGQSVDENASSTGDIAVSFANGVLTVSTTATEDAPLTSQDIAAICTMA